MTDAPGSRSSPGRKILQTSMGSLSQWWERLLTLSELLRLVGRAAGLTLRAAYRLVIPPLAKGLHGEVVLVTGTGHGIGRALALQFASYGSIVVCVDVDADSNAETLHAIFSKGRRGFAYTCDIAVRERVQDLAMIVRKEVGDVTILVNNAAIHEMGPLLRRTSDSIRREVDVNLMSHFWMLQAFLPSMIARNHGHVVALSSMCGVAGVENMVPYCATKYAVAGIMDALREELRQLPRPSSVKVTTVYPFYVDTGMVPDPGFRMPALFGAVTPLDAAISIVHAVRREETDVSVPRLLLPLERLTRVLPAAVGELVLDFLAKRQSPSQ